MKRANTLSTEAPERDGKGRQRTDSELRAETLRFPNAGKDKHKFRRLRGPLIGLTKNILLGYSKKKNDLQRKLY